MPEIFSNTTLTVNQLIEKIDTGELGLPELQRPFIWKDSKVRDLFDSMMRGYPIGYLMLMRRVLLSPIARCKTNLRLVTKPRRTTQNGFIILVTCSLPRTPLSSSVISSRNWVTIDPPKGPSLQMKNRA